jgi:hypothetical protein
MLSSLYSFAKMIVRRERFLDPMEEEEGDLKEWHRSEISFAEILCGSVYVSTAEIPRYQHCPCFINDLLTPNHPSLVAVPLLPESTPPAREPFTIPLDPEATGSPTYRQQSTSNRSSSRLMSETLAADVIVCGTPRTEWWMLRCCSSRFGDIERVRTVYEERSGRERFENETDAQKR